MLVWSDNGIWIEVSVGLDVAENVLLDSSLFVLLESGFCVGENKCEGWASYVQKCLAFGCRMEVLIDV